MTNRPSTLAEAVGRSVAASPRKLAISLDRTERTYEQLVGEARTWARTLHEHGLQPGDRFGVLLPNCMTYVELLLAASMAGLVVVPINTRFKASELNHIISHSRMKLLVMVREITGFVTYTELLKVALPSLREDPDFDNLYASEAPALSRVLIVDPAEQIETTEAGRAPTAQFEGGDGNAPFIIMYTSGTTAKPKGCIISERAFLCNITSIIEHFSLGADDIWWCPLPMFHIGGMLFPCLALTMGGTYLTTAHFETEAAIEQMVAHPPTVIYPLFPTITLQLIEHSSFSGLQLDQVRYVCNVAPVDLQRRIQRAIQPARLLNAFGMTEASGVVTYSRPDDTEDQRLTSCGFPLAGWEIGIFDHESRARLPAGEKGEIGLKGPGLFSGYLDDAEATARQFTQDGFFLTGDAGMLDEDGLLYFLGRLKDQLKVGGENVSALEVESFLATHSAVKLAQVIGLPDERYGEVPVAFVERHDGQSVTEAELLDFCSGKIARFKIPRYIRFVQEWPMSATKIQKFKLKDIIQEELKRSVTPEGVR